MRSRRSRILFRLAVLVGVGLVGAAVAAVVFWATFVRDLPDLRSLDDYQPALASTVYDREGRPIGEFFEERRRLVSLDEIPEYVIEAFVAGEDGSFFEHEGIDFRSILRAAWVNLVAGGIEQGASTITQQTVKTLLLSPERRYERKIKEMILARRLEHRLTKQEILFLYLNQIYFGSGAYGIGEAARTYFGKPVSELTISEGALLAGLPKAPSRNSPIADPKAADQRRRYVLGRMAELGYLDDAAFQAALEDVPEVTGPPEREDALAARWFTEEVRRFLFQELEGEQVLRGGLQVETTLDIRLQRAAETALRKGLVDLDHRQGWHGPIREIAAEAIPAELEALAEENGLSNPESEESPEAMFPEQEHVVLEPGQVVMGVVVSLDKGAKTARVALAPEVEGVVRLKDVSWARPRDPSRYPNPRTRIGRVFSVGDVAQFEVMPASSQGGEGETGPLRLRLHQEPQVEGALLALSLPEGEVLALVGGYDFERSQFDRAVQAHRQPGSAFKPLIYATAMTEGFTPVTTLYDRPVVYTDEESGFTWRPQNYGRRFLGPIPLRDALARSVNNATIHLLKDVGVGPVIEFSRTLGIRSPLERNLSLALGTSPVSLLELTRAYAVFPAGGRRVPARFIRRVLDAEGNVLLENVVLDEEPRVEDVAKHEREVPAVGASQPDEPAAPAGGSAQQLVSPAEAFLATDLLRWVVESPKGTGKNARVLKRPLGGKTGTTNDQGDAWFLGFSTDVAAGVWLGFDERQVLGRTETGGRAALPVWIDFMRAAHEGVPKRNFRVPEGISFARVDRATGKLADRTSQDSYFQAFLAGSEPGETASDVLSQSESRRLLRMDF